MIDASEAGFTDGAQLLGSETPPRQHGNTAIPVLGSEALQHNLPDGLISAVAVEQDDVPKSVPDHGFEDVADVEQEGFVPDGQRAGEIHMMLRAADLDLWQNQHFLSEALFECLQEVVA